jgi:DNA-binding HxlR family transcriptional regulator
MKAEPFCPVAATLHLIDGKWKPSILLQLKDGPVHFNELLRRLPHVTRRIMTLQLRQMERDGIVKREAGSGNPPKMFYSISEKGVTLGPALEILENWGAANFNQRA